MVVPVSISEAFAEICKELEVMDVCRHARYYQSEEKGMYRKGGQGKCVSNVCVFKDIFPGMGIWTLVTPHPQFSTPENMDINKCIRTITNKTDIY